MQDKIVDQLSRKGWEVNSVDPCGEEDTVTVFLSKRVKSYSTIYAEVDSTGLVNGVPLAQFKP